MDKIKAASLFKGLDKMVAREKKCTGTLKLKRTLASNLLRLNQSHGGQLNACSLKLSLRKLRRFDLNFITGRNIWELIFFIILPGRRHWQRMQSLRKGIPAERFAHCPLHQGPAFEDHDHILAGVLGLVRQLRPRAGGRRVRRVHGHEQAHPDEEVLRDGLRLPGEIPSQLYLVKFASITSR